MGADIHVQPATHSDAKALALLMRPDDVREVEANGMGPLEAVLASLATSCAAYACHFDGEVAAVWGVCPIDSREGLAWCLTGKVVARRKKDFLRVSKVAVAALAVERPILHALVDARYAAALRWVRWLGFEDMGARPFGPGGHLFHHVRRQAWA